MYAFDEKKISESVLRLVFGFESPCNREVGDLVCKLIFSVQLLKNSTILQRCEQVRAF